MIGLYSIEARSDYERRTCWFFLFQCFEAVAHLTDSQHCDVDSITYSGVYNGRHCWLARS